MRRKLKVLLANLPWQRNGIWGVRAGSRWPHIKDESEGYYLPFPFFLAHATSLLQKYNINTSIIDAIAERIPEGKFLEKLSEMNIDYLVAETSIPSFYYDMQLLKKISSMGISTILCGPNSEIYQPQFLKNHSFVDFVLYGEYEFTLLDLIKSLQDGGDIRNVKGIVYRDSGSAIKTLQRAPFDINLLPWPHRNSLSMDKYLDAPGEMLTPSVQMLASRGCPFGCQFCLWPQVIYFGHHYRARDVKDTIDEMENLVREEGFKSVYFDDDTFNIGKERMLNFCREIRIRGLDKVQWAIMARPDLMDEEILEEMKKSGLWAVKYGVESATQSLVDNIEKNMNLKKAEKMIKFTKKLGIKTHLTFTFGLPGETKQTIERTIRCAQRLDPFSVQFSIMTPFPGTKYYEVLERKGLIISKDLSCYDGHFKSVIQLEDLTGRDLEMAKEKAFRSWKDHLRKKRKFWGSVKRFCHYARNKSLGYAVNKAIRYSKYILLKRKKYLSYEGFEDVANSHSTDMVLIQCPPWDVFMPPLGIAYLSSYLDKYGYKVSVFDLNIALHHLADEDAKYLWDQKSYDWWVDEDLFKKTWDQLREITTNSLAKNLEKVDARCIGLSVNFASIRFAVEILKIIKSIKNETKIILGGWGCINEHMRGLFPGELIDAFVIGEGEETLREVMEVLKGKREEEGVSGVIFNKNRKSVYKPRPSIMDLDSIPWPTFSKFHLSQYKSRALPLFTSRGCIGCCSFCNDWSISKPYRSYSAHNIFKEIKYHVENNCVDVFSFKDLLCNGNINELNLLSDLIINSGLKICWDSQAITRKEMNCEILSKLKRAGCGTLIYGVESFSNNVLRQMRKLFTVEIAERVIKDTYKAGIMAIVNIIVGFPGETESDFQETVEAIKRNQKYISKIGAISICLVNNDSDLDLNYGSYGLVLPSDPKIRAKKWTDIDGKNTYETRRKRAEIILELVNRLGFSYETKTI